ncbi:hypothetical protein ACFOQM_06320 [Paenibacillus sp. GCM10012307]|uniref:Uncharacterized protein n=1 Tax=Paenibacillus roseus TaxID=2798579 RepID=A0A934J074_9BACL|nr:hypothetical protein [Paenibacillus roseus]MBJ6360914.1 hypothetical protein [Paenibacillus roseus]
MDHDRVAKHTALIEQEDDLLKQLETCQVMLAAAWRCARSSGENLHLPTVHCLISAWRSIFQLIDDEALQVQLHLLPFATLSESDH